MPLRPVALTALPLAAASILHACAAPAVRKLSPEAYARINQPDASLDAEIAELEADARRPAPLSPENEAKLREDLPKCEFWSGVGDQAAAQHSLTAAGASEPKKSAMLQFERTIESAKRDGESTREAAARMLREGRAALRAAETARVESRRKEDQAEKLRKAADDVRDARASGAGSATDGAPFFSFTPLVAFRGGLHGTSIPAVAVNAQPFDFGKDSWFTPMGVQAIFGGVLNPSSESSGPSAAAGAGIWYPIGPNGSIAIGWTLWEDGSETRSGVYIGLSLGQSSKPIERSH